MRNTLLALALFGVVGTLSGPAAQAQTSGGTAAARAPAADPAQLLFYPGSYVTDGPVVTIAMGEDGQLTAQVGDSSALPMRLVAPDDFSVAQATARVLFHREEGRISGLTVYYRGRELKGRRHAG